MLLTSMAHRAAPMTRMTWHQMSVASRLRNPNITEMLGKPARMCGDSTQVETLAVLPTYELLTV